jgi:CubicO group peptidase (beta-lactamase class C family)/beta-lactamase class A
MMGLCVLSLSANAQKRSTELPTSLDSYINQVLKTFEVPGVAVAIVKDGKVLLSKGYGVKRMGTTDPVDENTLFLIASNSKAFTATSLAILVEDGKLKWEDKVVKYMPWFKMSDEYVTNHLTVRDLLVHHSGLPAYGGDVMLFPPASYSRREVLDKLRYIPLKYDFRTTYAYDNILYVAAGELISTVSGMSWEDFVKNRIFSKVGMKESISKYTELKTQKNFAWSHARSDSKIHVVENFMDRNIGDVGNAAGGICSNAADMANWLITQLDSGRTPSNTKIFQPETTKELWKIVRPMPITPLPDYLKPAQQSFWGYALGFRAYNYGKYKVVGHGGALRGFVSQIAMVPELKLGVVVLTNQQSTGAYWSIINHVLDHYMQNKPFNWMGGYKRQLDSTLANAAARKKNALIKKDSLDKPSLPFEKYTGTYTENLLGNITISKDSQRLVMRFENSPHYVADLEYFQYNNFIARFRGNNEQAFISFAINPNGTIDHAKIKATDEDSDLDFDEMILKPVSDKIKDTADLKNAISAEFGRHPEGNFAVAVKDLSTGKTFFINERENFHAASTMKTPVMIEAYKQAAAGKFAITDSIVIKNKFRSIVDGSDYSLDSADDSEHDLYTRIGSKLPIYDVLHRMITMSSNLATNIMIDLVGAKNANATMRDLGAKDIQVLRGVEDDKAFEKGMNNTVTAYDLMLVMETIAQGKAVNKESSDAMIKILMDQHFTDKIAKKLPAGVKVASKSGSIASISHDSGIVFLPDGRKYIVVLLSRGVEDYDYVNSTLANVSRLIYNYIR